MDEFMAQLLEEKRQKILLQQDAIHKKIPPKKYGRYGATEALGKFRNSKYKSKTHLFLSMI